ncbi:MAG TPA: hypothetical protein VL096_03295, partial [Pirellulaceae bacterium]|nr:hypothetical protein [Pirellulaceae bacterium]
LDDQLLDDLNSDLLPNVTKPEQTTPSATKPPIEGEDIELGAPQDPLAKIGERMRAVETLIGRHDTSAGTQDLQKQILRDLDQLLEQTKKQCQNGQCQPGAKSSSPSSQSQGGQKPMPGSEPGEASNKPATDSTDELRKSGEAKVAEAAAMDQLVKEVWGHLPEKVRSQMQNVGVEQFLPKYEKLIEDYYKRLAEEQSR